MRYRMVVIGASAGGFKALKVVLSPLPNDFSIPIAIVLHQTATSDDYLVHSLGTICPLRIKFAEDREKPQAGSVFLAPPDHHLLFHEDRTFALSSGARVNYSRPSIDLLFMSAAQRFGPAAIGVILTGANQDGAQGLRLISDLGGLTVVQNPKTADARTMPQAAMDATVADHIIRLDQIGPFLWDIQRKADQNDT